MSMISEQVNRLRGIAEDCRTVSDHITAKYIDGAADTIEELSAKLHNSQPVTPQQKMGHWKAYTHSAYHGNNEYDEPIWREVVVYHCSECNRRTVIKENYCPNCGTIMKDEADA